MSRRKRTIPAQKGSATGSPLPGSRRDTLTRGQVAKRLGCSVSTVRRMEGSELKPKVDADGVRRFDHDEVERAARSLSASRATPNMADGEIAAAAFQMFKEGKDLSDAVIVLKQTPTVIRALYAGWENMANRMVLSSGTVMELDKLVAAGLLDQDISTAMENDNAEGIRERRKELMAQRVAARRP